MDELKLEFLMKSTKSFLGARRGKGFCYRCLARELGGLKESDIERACDAILAEGTSDIQYRAGFMPCALCPAKTGTIGAN